MGMLICKDVGCELMYCQSTISDPNNRPFTDCEAPFRNFNQCIGQQINMFEENNLGKTMQEYTLYMIEKRKKELHSHLFIENNKTQDEDKEERILKTKNQMQMGKTSTSKYMNI
jgi:hypothetical protein